MPVLLTNNATSTLASGITAAATSLTLASGTGAKFPSPTNGDWFPLTLDSGTVVEVCRCTARIGDVLTVTRAQEGTTAAAFSAGAKAELRLTAGTMLEYPRTVWVGTDMKAASMGAGWVDASQTAGVGSRTIPANALRVGSCIRHTAVFEPTNLPASVQFRLKIGAATSIPIVLVAVDANSASRLVRVVTEAVVTTIGASGGVYIVPTASGRGTWDHSSQSFSATPLALNTTVANTVVIQGEGGQGGYQFCTYLETLEILY